MENTKDKIVRIYTDGACSGNPGPGGWGAVLIYGKHEKDLSGCDADTTNNRMELMAPLQALASLKRPSVVHVFTDSQYVMYGMEQWVHKWKQNGWLNSQKKPVKNSDLWQQLDALCQIHQVKWHWVKGHSGHPENTRADALARNAIIKGMMEGKN